MNTLQLLKQLINHAGWEKCLCWDMIMLHATLVLGHDNAACHTCAATLEVTALF
jgi:hypothetical protein